MFPKFRAQIKKNILWKPFIKCLPCCYDWLLVKLQQLGIRSQIIRSLVSASQLLFSHRHLFKYRLKVTMVLDFTFGSRRMSGQRGNKSCSSVPCCYCFFWQLYYCIMNLLRLHQLTHDSSETRAFRRSFKTGEFYS